MLTSSKPSLAPRILHVEAYALVGHDEMKFFGNAINLHPEFICFAIFHRIVQRFLRDPEKA